MIFIDKFRATKKSSDYVDGNISLLGSRSNHVAWIDGLRAVAVLPVVFFHAGIPGFGGGFIGVDVFFVISGFLITKILLRSSETSLRRALAFFYIRRARRILPALFLVTAASTLIGWLTLGPAQFVAFLKSALATIFMVSNFYFAEGFGYFADNSDELPLLHTWTLSVEEQFYLVFPILFLILQRRGRKWLIGSILFLFVSSLGLAQLLSSTESVGSYFSIATRAWELLFGALAAFLASANLRALNHRKLTSALSTMALISLLLSFIALDQRFPYPSLWTMIPVAATSGILVFTTNNSLVSKILSFRPFVVVGLISYSVYLWHQPVFAFWRIHTGREEGILTSVFLIFFVLILAFLSWKFVENPFRNKVLLSNRSAFYWLASAALSLLALVLVGLLTTKVIPAETAADRQIQPLTHSQIIEVMEKKYDRGTCFLDIDQAVSALTQNGCLGSKDSGGRFILFGDSFAAHYAVGAREYVGTSFHQWTAASCRPVEMPDQSQRCSDFVDGFLTESLKALNSSDTVFISARWNSAYEVLGAAEFQRRVSKTLEVLAESGARLVLVGPTPEWESSPRALQNSEEAASRNLYLDVKLSKSVEKLREIAAEQSTQFVDTFKAICETASRCQVKRDGNYLFLDGGHLSPAGSQLVFRYILDSST